MLLSPHFKTEVYSVCMYNLSYGNVTFECILCCYCEAINMSD